MLPHRSVESSHRTQSLVDSTRTGKPTSVCFPLDFRQIDDNTASSISPPIGTVVFYVVAFGSVVQLPKPHRLKRLRSGNMGSPCWSGSPTSQGCIPDGSGENMMVVSSLHLWALCVRKGTIRGSGVCVHICVRVCERERRERERQRGCVYR